MDRSWEYINRSQTHEYGEGLRPRSSFSGNTEIEISLQCDCEVKIPRFIVLWSLQLQGSCFYIDILFEKQKRRADQL
jgi:hypothetical protein